MVSVDFGFGRTKIMREKKGGKKGTVGKTANSWQKAHQLERKIEKY
jgi:hypothetical protein